MATLNGEIIKWAQGNTVYAWNGILLKEGVQDIPCNPLAALLTYVKRRGLVSQGNREGRIYTHLQR